MFSVAIHYNDIAPPLDSRMISFHFISFCFVSLPVSIPGYITCLKMEPLCTHVIKFGH